MAEDIKAKNFYTDDAEMGVSVEDGDIHFTITSDVGEASASFPLKAAKDIAGIIIIDPFVSTMKEAMQELLDERGMLLQRTADRWKTLAWILKALEKGEIPSKDEIQDQILVGKYDDVE